MKVPAIKPINQYLTNCIANAHGNLPCIRLVKPYLNEYKIHNRDIALIRLTIIVLILRDQVADPLFAEFGLKLECGLFNSYLSSLQAIIAKQKIDRFDHSANASILYDV